MDRRQFLTKVKEEAELDSLRQADQATRVIVAFLKSVLPEDIAGKVADVLPEDLRTGWESVVPYPADILEREDFYYEGSSEEPKGVPTITQG